MNVVVFRFRGNAKWGPPKLGHLFGIWNRSSTLLFFSTNYANTTTRLCIVNEASQRYSFRTEVVVLDAVEAGSVR